MSKYIYSILIRGILIAFICCFIAGCIKLTADDGSKDDHFGISTCISGDYAVVGAPAEIKMEYGSIYIFKRDDNNWVQEVKLTANDGMVMDWFGTSVSISGDYIIVGAPGSYDDTGLAYIFRREGNTWTQEATLIASDSTKGHGFGRYVSISGDYVIVGAPWNHENPGSAYIFRREGSTWSEEARLIASDGEWGDEFGTSVSISGDYTVIGAPGDNNDNGINAGSAYIFKRDGNTWIQEVKLIQSDNTEDYFGTSAAIDEDYIIIGAKEYNKYGLSFGGSANIYKHNGDNWVQEAKLTAKNLMPSNYLDFDVTISNNHAVIGAIWANDNPIACSVTVYSRNGSAWTKQTNLNTIDSSQNDYFGFSVSISDNNVIVGAPLGDGIRVDSGSAYIFTLH